MKLTLLSSNLMITITELIKDQYLAKLLSVYTQTPIDSENVNPNMLVNKNIFPTAFNVEVPEEQKVELRVFYPNGSFNDANNIAISDIYFQIIFHRDLSFIEINGEKKLRELEIMDRIIELFNKKHIGTLGRIQFQGYEYGHISKDYGMYTLVGEVMNL